MASARQPAITITRIYDEPHTGHRVLVDRLWPRGVKKDGAPIDEWCKDAAPSTALRQWYGHDPARFEEFARRYRAELHEEPASSAVAQLARLAARRQLTLVTATKDVEHSAARVLHAYLMRRARRSN